MCIESSHVICDEDNEKTFQLGGYIASIVFLTQPGDEDNFWERLKCRVGPSVQGKKMRSRKRLKLDGVFDHITFFVFIKEKINLSLVNES